MSLRAIWYQRHSWRRFELCSKRGSEGASCPPGAIVRQAQWRQDAVDCHHSDADVLLLQESSSEQEVDLEGGVRVSSNRTERKICAGHTQHACGHVESGNEAHTTVQALGSVSFPGKMPTTIFRVITSHDGVLILFLNKSHLKLFGG